MANPASKKNGKLIKLAVFLKINLTQNSRGKEVKPLNLYLPELQR